MSSSLLDRFVVKVEALPTGCWRWTAHRTKEGYGRFRVSKAVGMRFAHRVAFAIFFGPIPPGMEADHECRNRWCVNPLHLRIVTHAQNQAFMAAARTRCPAGHPFDKTNTRVAANGSRFCRACGRDWWRRNKDRMNARRRAA